MKALADRIGLSSENHDFSLTKDKESTEAENNTVGVDMQKMKRSSEEQSSVHRTQEHNKPFSQSENVIAGHVELSAYCISSAEKIAKDVLRPAIAEWLQHKLPVCLKIFYGKRSLGQLRSRLNFFLIIFLYVRFVCSFADFM